MIDVRSLVPLDTQTILGSVARTHRAVHGRGKSAAVRLGRGARSIVADEAFYDLDGPPVRITTPHIPLPVGRYSKMWRCQRRSHRRSRAAQSNG